MVFLDLEDAVAPDDKAQARKNVIEALNDMDWSHCSVSVRINGLDTHYCYRDIVDVVEQAGDKLDTILIPKVGSPSDILFVSTMLEQIEAAKGYKPINLHILIETAMGMANVESIAQTCPERLEAMVFGVADYAASTQARTTNMGGANPDYYTLTHPDEQGRRERHWGDQWHFAASRLVVACRAYGLRPIDGPFGDFNDPDGYLAAAGSMAALGIEGKWAIHPSQIELAHQVFTPGDSGSRPRTPYPGRDGRGREGRPRRGGAGRAPDRCRIHSPGTGAGQQGRPDPAVAHGTTVIANNGEAT